MGHAAFGHRNDGHSRTSVLASLVYFSHYKIFGGGVEFPRSSSIIHYVLLESKRCALFDAYSFALTLFSATSKPDGPS